MSEEKAPESPQGEVQAETKVVKQEAAPPQPKIDIEAIKSQAVEEAKKAMAADKGKLTAEIKQEIAQKLTGEEPKAEVNDYLKAFLTDTEGFLSAQHETIINDVTRRIEEKNKQAHQDEKVLADVTSEYPELKEHIDYLDLEFTKLDQKDPNRPRKEKIEEAAQTIAKRLKIKPLSEREKDEQYLSAAYPSSGSASWGSGEKATDSQKSAMDFIQGRKGSVAKTRSRG